MTPTVAHIALSSVAVTCPHSAVTRTGRADFFSCVHLFTIFLLEFRKGLFYRGHIPNQAHQSGHMPNVVA